MSSPEGDGDLRSRAGITLRHGNLERVRHPCGPADQCVLPTWLTTDETLKFEAAQRVMGTAVPLATAS